MAFKKAYSSIKKGWQHYDVSRREALALRDDQRFALREIRERNTKRTVRSGNAIELFGKRGNTGDKIFWGIIAVMAIIILPFFNKIVKKIQSIFFWSEQKDKENEEKAKDGTNKVNDLVPKTIYNQCPNPKAYYDAIADKLEICMQGWGTDWKGMVNTLEPLSGTELKAVYRSFGARINEDFVNEVFDLFGWFNDEYSTFSFECLMNWPKLVKIWSVTDLPNKIK